MLLNRSLMCAGCKPERLLPARPHDLQREGSVGLDADARRSVRRRALLTDDRYGHVAESKLLYAVAVEAAQVPRQRVGGPVRAQADDVLYEQRDRPVVSPADEVRLRLIALVVAVR